MNSNQRQSRVRGGGWISLCLLGALVVSTGRPNPETLASLTGAGVPESVSVPALYVAPVVGIALVLLLGSVLGKGRSTRVRWLIYAACGGAAGFFMGVCLDLFAAVPGIIESLVGPLAEAGGVEIALWALTGLCIFMGLMVGAFALFGRPAVSAMQVEEVDPECLDVRRAERVGFGVSAIGMITLAIATGALATARLAPEDNRLVIISVALAAALASAILNYVLWRGFDEMQRRHVVDGYASSAVVVTLGAFVWAALHAVGAAPVIDAAGVFVVLTIVQLIATVIVTSKVIGDMSAAGKAA